TANKHCGDKLCRAITMWSLLFAPFATTLCDHCDFERTATSAPESLDFKGMSDDCARCDHKSSACGFNKINCLLCGVGLYCLIQYKSSSACNFSLNILAVLNRLLVDSKISRYVV